MTPHLRKFRSGTLGWREHEIIRLVPAHGDKALHDAAKGKQTKEGEDLKTLHA